jgi:hypothetical protein
MSELDRTIAPYETDTWTPVLTFATAGDQSVAYTTQSGIFTRIGRVVVAQFFVWTSTFTHTTASGELLITGLPYTAHATISGDGSMHASGWTDADAVFIVPRVNNATSQIDFRVSRTGATFYSMTTADWPTGGTVIIVGTVTYTRAET